jgi:hypothetical protein
VKAGSVDGNTGLAIRVALMGASVDEVPERESTTLRDYVALLAREVGEHDTSSRNGLTSLFE